MRPLLFLALFPLAVFACTVGANVGDLDRPIEDGGTESTASDGSSTENKSKDGAIDPSPDADSDPAAIDGGCGVVLPQYGKFFDVELVMDGPPPFPKGGTIVPGIYELLARRYYYGSDTGTMAVRETMRIRGSTSAGSIERLLEAKDASGTFKPYAAHGESSTFEVQGPTLVVTTECPKDDLHKVVEFETSGDDLTLFDNSTSEERVYRRIE